MLQEFFVTTTRKIPKPLGAPAAAQIIGDLAHWHLHAPAAGDVLAAIDIHQRTGASFWDAMILRSAKETRLRYPALGGSQPRPGIRGRPGPQPIPGLAASNRMRLKPASVRRPPGTTAGCMSKSCRRTLLLAGLAGAGMP